VGTFHRNKVCRNEETLWKSVTLASPGNGRAWMNYGLILMARADYARARSCFEKADALLSDYDVLEINMGILEGASNRPLEEERHFQRALSLNSRVAMVHFYYGRWLHERRRNREAAEHLVAAIAGSPVDLAARHLLMEVYRDWAERGSGCVLARETVKIAPADPKSAARVQDCLTL
jgi:tetratricopeptide (TPR) repeat protein